MKLVRLSVYSIWGCLFGLAALASVALILNTRVQSLDAQVAELFELRERLSDLTTGSQSLLFFGSDPQLLETYLEEGALVRHQLEALAEVAPRARKGARHLSLLMENLTRVLSAPQSDRLSRADDDGFGPLGLHSSSRMIINNLMNHSIALDSVLDQLIIERRGAITQEGVQIRTVLAGTALLFGILCMMAFSVIYRYVGRPVQELATTIGQINQGQQHRRAAVRGNHELADLAQTLNRMLDQNVKQQAELHRSNEWLIELLGTRKALINALPANIALVNSEGVIQDVNDRWRRFGRENGLTSDNSGIGLNYLTLCDQSRDDEDTAAAREAAAGLQRVLSGSADEEFALEYPCHSPDKRRWFRVTINRLADRATSGERLGAVIMHLDITERKLAERELERLANRDGLTGLLSRGGFTRALSEEIQRGGWPQTTVVLILDIVGQRDVNDAHGYDMGDQLLIQFGERLFHYLGQRGFVGRIGGAEFVMSLPEDDVAPFEDTLTELWQRIEEPFHIEQVSLEVTARMGFTRLGKHSRQVESLIREAELALFQNATNSLAPWLEFTDDLDRQVHERLETARELRTALKQDQLELHFQPKVDLETGELVACEALIRWNHPTRGLLPPGAFIPVAEQSQLIGPIGTWTLRQACKHLRAWQDAGLSIVRVAVNVSLVQFQLEDLPTTVASILREFRIDPSALSLEITESVFERESWSLNHQLKALHAMGVRLSLDDFGTGYSSLLYLQTYPFDEIKIDKGFVQRIETDAYSLKIVELVLGLAHALGAEIVAEGVETHSMGDALIGLGCRWAQGFYYSFPLASEDFQWLLEKRATLPLIEDTRSKTMGERS